MNARQKAKQYKKMLDVLNPKVKQPKYEMCKSKIETLKTCMFFPLDVPSEDYVKNELCHSILKYMIENDIVNYKCSIDERTRHRKAEAWIRVINEVEE